MAKWVSEGKYDGMTPGNPIKVVFTFQVRKKRKVSEETNKKLLKLRLFETVRNFLN